MIIKVIDKITKQEKQFSEVKKHDTVYFVCETCSANSKRKYRYDFQHHLCTSCKLKQISLEKYGVDNPNKSDIVKESKKKSCMEKYGVENPMQCEEIKAKNRATCLVKYGVEYPCKAESVKEKNKQTCLRKYGVDNPSKSEHVKEKRKQTFIKRYGVENASLIDEVKKKRKQTFIKRFGVDSPMKCEEVKAKSRKTCLDKYGVSSPMKNEKVKEKLKQTLINRFGVSSSMKNEKVKAKSRKTCSGKYNSEHYVSSDDFKQTCLEKFGVDNPSKCEAVKEKIKQSIFKHYGAKNYMQSKDYQKNKEQIKNKVYLTKKKNNSFHTSKSEDKLYEELKEEYGEVIRQYRDKRYPFTCDFYIPEEDLFIELNLFWTHGGAPFDINNEQHAKKLAQWRKKSCNSKFFQAAIDTWTVRDVEKLKTAKKNNLNYTTIYSV